MVLFTSILLLGTQSSPASVRLMLIRMIVFLMRYVHREAMLDDRLVLPPIARAGVSVFSKC